MTSNFCFLLRGALRPSLFIDRRILSVKRKRQFCSRVREHHASTRRSEELSSVKARETPAPAKSYDGTTIAEDDDSREGHCGVQLIDVSDLAHEMRAWVRAYTSSLATAHRPQKPPRMVGILASSSASSAAAEAAAETYSNTIASKFAQDGLEYHLHRCTPETIEECIGAANQDPNVHGILVFYPVFPHTIISKPTTRNHDTALNSSPRNFFLNPQTGTYYQTPDDYLRDCVTPMKDVEGLCRESRRSQQQARLLFRARGGLHEHHSNKLDIYIPCTAQACFQILERYHEWRTGRSNNNNHSHHDVVRNGKDDNTTRSCTEDFWSGNYSFGHERWKGSTVTVINRSNIFGRPLSALLALEGATVYSVDDRSILQFQNGSGRRCCSHMSLTDCLRESEVIVTAVPRDDFCLDGDAVQDHATIVDVSEQSNVNVKYLQRRGIKLIANIGKVTVAALEQNLVRLHRQHAIHVKSMLK